MGYIARYSFFLLLSGRIAEQDRRSPFWNLKIQCSRFLLFIEIGRNDHFLYFWLTGLQNRTGGFLSETGKIYFPGYFHDFQSLFYGKFVEFCILFDRTAGQDGRFFSLHCRTCFKPVSNLFLPPFLLWEGPASGPAFSCVGLCWAGFLFWEPVSNLFCVGGRPASRPAFSCVGL